MTVPWSDDPTSIFPPRPPPNKPIEAIARDVRFNRLFLGSHILRAPCIAFAHHADDQVETSIFRLAHGSSKIGAMGMKPVRRWGMGDRHTLTRFGAAGMSRFIVRPLLEVSKVGRSSFMIGIK